MTIPHGLGYVVQSQLIPLDLIRECHGSWVVMVAYPGVDVPAMVKWYQPLGPNVLVTLSMADHRKYGKLGAIPQLGNEPDRANQWNQRPEEYVAIVRELQREGYPVAGPAVCSPNPQEGVSGPWMARFAAENVNPTVKTMHGYGAPLASLDHHTIYTELGPEGAVLTACESWSGQGVSPFASFIQGLAKSGLTVAAFQFPCDDEGTPGLAHQVNGVWQLNAHGVSLKGLMAASATGVQAT